MSIVRLQLQQVSGSQPTPPLHDNNNDNSWPTPLHVHPTITCTMMAAASTTTRVTMPMTQSPHKHEHEHEYPSPLTTPQPWLSMHNGSNNSQPSPPTTGHYHCHMSTVLTTELPQHYHRHHRMSSLAPARRRWQSPATTPPTLRWPLPHADNGPTTPSCRQRPYHPIMST